MQDLVVDEMPSAIRASYASPALEPSGRYAVLELPRSALHVFEHSHLPTLLEP